MAKKTIKMNETQLRNMIAESVKKVLKEGNGQFSALYKNKNAPNSYDTKINELLRRYSDLQYEQEQLEKEIDKYTNWSWEEFCEYANEKYGLTRQNMDTNWQNFADAEYNKEILNNRKGKEGSGFSTDGTRAF